MLLRCARLSPLPYPRHLLSAPMVGEATSPIWSSCALESALPGVSVRH